MAGKAQKEIGMKKWKKERCKEELHQRSVPNSEVVDGKLETRRKGTDCRVVEDEAER